MLEEEEGVEEEKEEAMDDTLVPSLDPAGSTSRKQEVAETGGAAAGFRGSQHGTLIPSPDPAGSTSQKQEVAETGGAAAGFGGSK